MRHPMLARAREAGRIVGFSMAFALAALVTNLLVMALFVVTFGSFDDGRGLLGPTGIDDVSAGLVAEDGAYRASDETLSTLRETDRWAMLIADDGTVAWSTGLPADVPTHYTLADVASFSRWYLADYPVVTRVRDDGLLVIGSPKGSAWKYHYSTNMQFVVLFLGLVAAALVSNMIVAIVVARAYARRSWAERDHARREWIAAVSHDVRTPLAVALADADTLAQDDTLAPEPRVRAERVVAKVSEVASLVADLNVANRMSHAMEPAQMEPVTLAPIVRSVAVGALNDDTEGRFAVEVDIPEDAESLRTRGNEALLRRMLTNLVGNSVRHNPQGCTVRISLARLQPRFLHHARCLLVVEDDGRGLGSDMLVELQRPPSGELPEHGLGLVIVRRIAHACGGEARFSDAGGGGTRCEIELPLAD